MEATTAAIRRARDLDVDVLVTTGGASAGDHDLVKSSLEAEGTAITFWKIAMRPGKPMMHGTLGPVRVIGLPGNPVSSYVCAYLFMVPLIRALSGVRESTHRREPAVLGAALAANDQREDYLRAYLTRRDDGQSVATPVDRQDSSLLARLSQAQALIVRPPFAPAAEAGARCLILKLPS
jgi:molybdopterin molybdotransferase